jgi:AcrR family transcriptional regulator
MSRPKNADGQRTRQAILDAALDLFAEKGYFGTSLRDVATRVGVRESALYNYFPGKDALFEALLEAHRDSKAGLFAPLFEAPIGSARALLLQLAYGMLDSFVDPREEKLFRILMSDGFRLAKVGRINLHDRMVHRRHRLNDLMRRLIKEGWLRHGDVNVLALSFVSPLVVWRQMHAIDADSPIIRNPRAFARKHVEQFLRGAGAPTRKPS